MELMDMKDYDIDFKEKRTNGYLIATYHCRYIIFTAESRNDRSILI